MNISKKSFNDSERKLGFRPSCQISDRCSGGIRYLIEDQIQEQVWNQCTLPVRRTILDHVIIRIKSENI